MKENKNIPLVSIIVPVCNIAKYLSDCFESIRKQTYQNIEVLVINDGSADDSAAICDIYGELDQRFHILHQQNRGLSAARNKGLSQAKGEYIAFVDGDDYISTTYIERMLSILINYHAQISICEYARCRHGGFFENGGNQTKPVVEVLKSKEMLSQWYGKRKKVETVSWNKLYAAQLFRSQPADFFPVGRLHEDVATTHKIIAQASLVAVTNETLYCYRIRKGSITSSKWSGKQILDNYEANRSRLEYFLENGYKNAYGRLLEGMIKYELYYTFTYYIRYTKWYKNEK